MLHTLVLFVQFVGDHATYLGTFRTVCWRPCYIPWYFSYSLWATMLHTLVLFVQFVGDHATYLGTSRSLLTTMLHTLVLLVQFVGDHATYLHTSRSLWATMLHTLVLLIQFVGDHATYLGTSRTVCGRPCYIPWYFSYSLWATMLHTLVLLVQLVGDHADLEALVEATWFTSGPRQVVALLPPTSDALRRISALCQSQKRVLTTRVKPRCLYSHHCEQTLTTVHKLRTYIHFPTLTSNLSERKSTCKCN